MIHQRFVVIIAAILQACRGTPDVEAAPTSDVALAQQLIEALRAERYAEVRKLTMTLELAEACGAFLDGDTPDPEERAAYERSQQALESSARRLRRHLESRGFFSAPELVYLGRGHREKALPDGKRILLSTGVAIGPGVRTSGGIVVNMNDVVIELPDQAVGVDGRWYALRLIPEGLEEYFERNPE